MGYQKLPWGNLPEIASLDRQKTHMEDRVSGPFGLRVSPGCSGHQVTGSLSQVISGLVKGLCICSFFFFFFLKEKWSIHSFLTTAHNKLTCRVIFYFIFSFLFVKKNKILPATSACCGAVVRNECRNHFSFLRR
jgi:hypothetical protein